MKNANRNMILAAVGGPHPRGGAVGPGGRADSRESPAAASAAQGAAPPAAAPPAAGRRRPATDRVRRPLELREPPPRRPLRRRRYRHDSRYREPRRWAYVEGRWVARPYRGAVWVTRLLRPVRPLDPRLLGPARYR